MPELDCGEDAKHLIGEYIIPDLIAGLLHIDLINDNDECAGFIIYQIDDINNDWNLQEGYADIREIYIAPEYRRKRHGQIFCFIPPKMKLKEAGAKSRTACLMQKAIPFFTACGYRNTDRYNDELDCFVFEKKFTE